MRQDFTTTGNFYPGEVRLNLPRIPPIVVRYGDSELLPSITRRAELAVRSACAKVNNNVCEGEVIGGRVNNTLSLSAIRNCEVCPLDK